MRDLELRPIRDIPGGEAVALLEAGLGNAFGVEKSTAFWEWKHQLNPAGPSLGYAAYSPAGHLIALRPFMRWRLLDDSGAEVQAARAVDAVVHPQWQRNGVFSRLTMKALDTLKGEEVSLVFNTPNGRSTPGNRKMGWRVLGHPTVWVRPCLTRLLWSASSERSEPDEGIIPFEQHGDRLAARTERAAPPGGLTVLKDSAFLNWRYGQHPNLRYSLVETPRATAIVRRDRRAGRQGVALVDSFTETGSARGFAELLEGIRAHSPGAYVVSGPLPPGPRRRAAVARGFLPMAWRNVNLAARPITLSPDAAVFRSRARWRLTLGDLETF